MVPFILHRLINEREFMKYVLFLCHLFGWCAGDSKTPSVSLWMDFRESDSWTMCGSAAQHSVCVCVCIMYISFFVCVFMRPGSVCSCPLTDLIETCTCMCMCAFTA